MAQQARIRLFRGPPTSDFWWGGRGSTLRPPMLKHAENHPPKHRPCQPTLSLQNVSLELPKSLQNHLLERCRSRTSKVHSNSSLNQRKYIPSELWKPSKPIVKRDVFEQFAVCVCMFTLCKKFFCKTMIFETKNDLIAFEYRCRRQWFVCM